MKELRLRARRGTVRKGNVRPTQMIVHQGPTDGFYLSISTQEYLQLRGLGEMDVVVNVRVIPKEEVTRNGHG